MGIVEALKRGRDDLRVAVRAADALLRGSTGAAADRAERDFLRYSWDAFPAASDQRACAEGAPHSNDHNRQEVRRCTTDGVRGPDRGGASPVEGSRSHSHLTSPPPCSKRQMTASAISHLTSGVYDSLDPVR